MNVYDEIKQLEIESNKIRSKSMFTDNYNDEMEILVEKAKEIVDEFVIPEYNIEYTSYWNYDFKVKINDDSKLIYKLIHCTFAYKKNDVKFWYINLEISISEKSQKTITHKIWKFPILEQDSIIKVLKEKLISAIEEY